MVSQKSVHKFADGISPVQACAYQTELPGRKETGIDYRLLHHVQGCPAHIVEGIPECGSQKRLHTQAAITALHFLPGHLAG